MEIKPLRPYIYQPILWFGVKLGDWPLVIGLTIVTYIITTYLGVRISFLPASLLLTAGSFIAGVAFFNWARVGRHPHWLQHTAGAAARGYRFERERHLPIAARRKISSPPFIYDHDDRETTGWLQTQSTRRTDQGRGKRIPPSV